ncbi:hypothetical protein Csa_019193 [Cucumis sativus]|uniref:Uncharacterized protein n=1 Tax=Cucumis sativus TaxID=3659 RepID=A0A0A0LKU6_CUCSA|nr:hypothetical protein Csa_019193 [Cucumis sativus]
MWTRCTTITWAPHQRRRSSRRNAWDPLPNWLLVVAFLAFLHRRIIFDDAGSASCTMWTPAADRDRSDDALTW